MVPCIITDGHHDYLLEFPRQLGTCLQSRTIPYTASYRIIADKYMKFLDFPSCSLFNPSRSPMDLDHLCENWHLYEYCSLPGAPPLPGVGD